MGRRERTFSADDVKQQIDQQKRAIASPRAPDLQLHDRICARVLRLLACIELGHGGRAQLGRKLHARHQLFGRGDFLLGHAPVGFGDRAGQAEQRRDKGQRRRLPRVVHLHAGAIPQMAERNADRHA